MKTVNSTPNFNYGFPAPGGQKPTGQDVMDNVFFQSGDRWDDIRAGERFDYIVVGTGFCALAFAERIYEQNPSARVLMLERGEFFLAEHFQNLPLPYVSTLGGLSETFPWRLSNESMNGEYIRWQHGMVPFFGGRSIMWSSWCPRPTPEEMAGWPKATIDAAARNFADAETLLNVIGADDLTGGMIDGKPIYGALQQQIGQLFAEGWKPGTVSSATRSMPAPMAVAPKGLSGVDFEKFATPGPLLALMKKQQRLAEKGEGAPLTIVNGCAVTRILSQGDRATALETSRGVVAVGDADVVLAMGALPPTTLVLNSFPAAKLAGTRFTAHFISAIVARVPRSALPDGAALGPLELSAMYVAGKNAETGGQYHIQLTAIADEKPEEYAETAGRHMPDVVATASREQLDSSTGHVVFVCAVLGEMDHANAKNWLRLDPQGGEDRTANVLLQVTANAADLKVWNTMDEGAYGAVEKVIAAGKDVVEYWHPGTGGGEPGWRKERPAPEMIRVPGLVHEGSTLWIGEKDSPVDLEYRLRDAVDNVYVTGAGLWPGSGSWNPTLTMVALAQDLADQRYAASDSGAPAVADEPSGAAAVDGGSLEASAIPYALS